jgi:large subunit ribosomal protein L25
MEKISLNANIREEKGKGHARSLRRNGRIPAILYSKGKSTPISLDSGKIRKLILLGHAESTLIDLKIEGATEKADRIAILREYQREPLTGELLHADFPLPCSGFEQALTKGRKGLPRVCGQVQE